MKYGKKSAVLCKSAGNNNLSIIDFIIFSTDILHYHNLPDKNNKKTQPLKTKANKPIIFYMDFNRVSVAYGILFI